MDVFSIHKASLPLILGSEPDSGGSSLPSLVLGRNLWTSSVTHAAWWFDLICCQTSPNGSVRSLEVGWGWRGATATAM